MRNLQIESSIVELFWTDRRIFAIGSKGATEFNDNNDYKEQINIGKIWLNCHQGDILCASLRLPDSIVTCCSHGDLIFWRYETGHPYMRFNLNNPTHRMQIVYHLGDIKKIKSMKSDALRGDLREKQEDFYSNERFVVVFDVQL